MISYVSKRGHTNEYLHQSNFFYVLSLHSSSSGFLSCRSQAKIMPKQANQSSVDEKPQKAYEVRLERK